VITSITCPDRPQLAPNHTGQNSLPDQRLPALSIFNRFLLASTSGYRLHNPDQLLLAPTGFCQLHCLDWPLPVLLFLPVWTGCGRLNRPDWPLPSLLLIPVPLSMPTFLPVMLVAELCHVRLPGPTRTPAHLDRRIQFNPKAGNEHVRVGDDGIPVIGAGYAPSVS